MHSLGFWHEHTRPDRDEHITIDMDNVKKHHQWLWRKKKEGKTQYNWPYDICSVMHYTFSKSFLINDNGK